MIEPFLRDDGQGGIELVIPRGQGTAEIIPLSWPCAWRLARHVMAAPRR